MVDVGAPAPVDWQTTTKNYIKQLEGYRAMPYRDKFGKLTIGWGRCIELEGISTDEAEHMLDNDQKAAATYAVQLCPSFWQLSDNRKMVLVCMAFNLGLEGLSKFKEMLAAIAAQDWTEASYQLINSLLGRQLPERAAELAALLKNG